MCSASKLKSKPYNHTLAAELAAWSSIAYIDPSKVSKDILKQLIDTNTQGNYRVSSAKHNIQCFSATLGANHLLLEFH